MNIFVASDNNYVPHLETLLTSIGDTNKNVDTIHFYILDGGITDKAKQDIMSISKEFSNIQISFIEMNEQQIAQKFGTTPSKDRSLSAFARVFIPELIDDDKALYFDVDAIVMQDLSELYNIDLQNYAIAGVLDTNPIRRHIDVGLTSNEPYINSGMILWNLDKCREINLVEQCIEFVNARDGKIDAMDQGTINGVVSKMGLVKIIHPKFNVLTSVFQLNKNDILKVYELADYYSDELLHEATTKPVFVHFTPNMTTRPWVKHCTHPLKDNYWYYRLKATNCKKTLQKDTRKVKHKLLGWIYRNLPISIFISLTKMKNKV